MFLLALNIEALWCQFHAFDQVSDGGVSGHRRQMWHLLSTLLSKPKMALMALLSQFILASASRQVPDDAPPAAETSRWVGSCMVRCTISVTKRTCILNDILIGNLILNNLGLWNTQFVHSYSILQHFLFLERPLLGRLIMNMMNVQWWILCTISNFFGIQLKVKV